MRPRDRHSRHRSRAQEGQGRAVRARDRRAHGRGDRRQGRRQGGDPARRHHLGRLDRRRLRARRRAQGRAARRSPTASRGSSRCSRPMLLQEQGVAAGEERAGVRFAKNMCPSQGTMDIFVEPVLPRPQIVVCGSSPVAVAVADLGRRIGFAVTVCAPAAEQARLRARPTAASKATRCRSTKPARASSSSRRKGRGDEAALQAALAVDADYVAFVGSRKKAEALKATLGAARRRAGAAGEAQGAGRSRSRRHHAGGDRALDPRRDRRRASREATARNSRDLGSGSLAAVGDAGAGRTWPSVGAFMTQSPLHSVPNGVRRRAAGFRECGDADSAELGHRRLGAHHRPATRGGAGRERSDGVDCQSFPLLPLW